MVRFVGIGAGNGRYLAEATHVLVKPPERYLSQQGNVNWFSYLLLGQAGRDAENAIDYRRWERFASQ